MQADRVQNPDQNEALDLQQSAFDQAAPAVKSIEQFLLEKIRSAKSYDDIINAVSDVGAQHAAPLEEPLAIAIFNTHLLGRAQVFADVDQPRRQTSRATARDLSFSAIVLNADFEPLPFQEAIDFFRSKTDVTAYEFRRLEQLAQQRAFSIAGAATRQVRLSIRDLVEQALTDGLTLDDFQKQADQIMDRAGLSQRSPWYWETVYRTNLQTAYQVGRWKQMTSPAMKAMRPYLRYVSALLPTTRPSHREKHGLVYPVDHPFWNEWYPPNGFNCYCTVTSVSQSLLDRRGWKVSSEMNFAYPDADEGFQVNAGRADAI